MSAEVLGLGAVAMDIVLSCDHLPGKDGYAVIQKETVLPGGSCANVLVALSELGTHTGMITQLGDDTYGKKLLDDLQKMAWTLGTYALKRAERPCTPMSRWIKTARKPFFAIWVTACCPWMKKRFMPGCLTA